MWLHINCQTSCKQIPQSAWSLRNMKITNKSENRYYVNLPTGHFEHLMGLFALSILLLVVAKIPLSSEVSY